MHLRRLVMLLLIAPAAEAATFVVTRFDDPAPNACLAGDCSLREAVLAAEATMAADTVQLSAGSYQLTRACPTDSGQCLDLDLTRPTTVIGQGPTSTLIVNAVPNLVGIDRAHTRVLQLSGTSVTLRNLGLRDGHVATSSGGGQSGGCLLSSATTLVLTDVRIESCSTLTSSGAAAGEGGGIAVDGGSLTMTRVVVQHGSSQSGGGLHARNASIRGSVVDIRNNTAMFAGGGVRLHDTSLSLGGNSRLYSNEAYTGGGLYIGGFAGAEVGGAGATGEDRLRIVANGATANGAGIALSAVNPFGDIGPVTLRNLRVMRNIAVGDAAGVLIAVTASGQVGPVVFTDSEIAENDTNGDGGGLYVESTTAGSDTRMQRLSFVNNSAGGRGGAMFVLGGVRIQHVSTYENQGVGGGRALFVPDSVAAAPEVSFLTALEPLGAAIVVEEATGFHASVFAGACEGPWIDLGHNFHRDDAPGCPGVTAAAAQLSIAYGEFGGGHAVVGITSAASILRDQALNFPGTRDARAWLRHGLADAGAHEYDGVP